jgi:hypothetical protein
LTKNASGIEKSIFQTDFGEFKLGKPDKDRDRRIQKTFLINSNIWNIKIEFVWQVMAIL